MKPARQPSIRISKKPDEVAEDRRARLLVVSAALTLADAAYALLFDAVGNLTAAGLDRSTPAVEYALTARSTADQARAAIRELLKRVP